MKVHISASNPTTKMYNFTKLAFKSFVNFIEK